MGSSCIVQGARLRILWWPTCVGWGSWEESSEGRDVCIHIANSCCCTAETNATSKSNYVCLCSDMSESMWPHGLQPTRLLCPWNFPGKNSRVDCYFLLQGIFLTQELNLCLLYLLCWQLDSLPLCHLVSPHPQGKNRKKFKNQAAICKSLAFITLLYCSWSLDHSNSYIDH